MRPSSGLTLLVKHHLLYAGQEKGYSNSSLDSRVSIAFCWTVPKLRTLSRVQQDVSSVLHFNYVCIISFHKYNTNLKIHLRIHHVTRTGKITNAIVERDFSTDDEWMGKGNQKLHQHGLHIHMYWIRTS